MKKDIIAEHEDDLVFALDIGTRSVVGILGLDIDGVFTVYDHEQKFHVQRAMRDGQIEDVELVSKVCGKVKEALEQRHRVKLKKVAIAAAGRALRTIKASYSLKLQNDEEITEDRLKHLEYAAIAAAQEKFEEEIGSEAGSGFQCVGYSVLQYRIDDYPIRNLQGMRGEVAEADIIAAFLPFSVVKSLYAVTSRCGLEVSNLTLEPIAAINVIVPPDVRLLNIAIADVGAGTSDIAISKDGSIIAYAMATTAGDELTESIMSAYLTDFETAESIKKKLNENVDVLLSFKDILGVEQTYTRQEILEQITGSVDVLADAIAESVLSCNDGPPAAMFLIGGGSQIPGLDAKVAQKLGIPKNRVAHGGTQKHKHIDIKNEELMTPEFVTPIGIGTVASQFKGADFFSITVNGKRIMLMRSGVIKVIDALLLAGIKASSLLGRSSHGITYYLNGQQRYIRGSIAAAGEILVNGVESTLETPVKQGDAISVTYAKDGKDPVLELGSIPEVAGSNEEERMLLVNGEPEPLDYVIKNNDRVELLSYSDAEAAAEDNPADEDNPEGAALEEAEGEALQDDPEAEYEETKEEAAQGVKDKGGAHAGQAAKPEKLPGMSVYINGELNVVERSDSGDVRFLDLLQYTTINDEEPGDKLILKLNGRDANYTDVVNPNDKAEIRWQREDD